MSMKVKIVTLYFLRDGAKLPSHFQLFLNSCAYNKRFQWLFVTNAAEEYDVPDNVEILHWEFDKLKGHFQSKFDFSVSLDNPYKLCDYKVLYGYLFSEFLEGYDFWGYCDCTDVIWGDLGHFISDSCLEKYDKVYWKGHLTLYRNEEKYVKCFMEYCKDGITYKDILSRSAFCAPDETGLLNITDAWEQKGYTAYIADDEIADISPVRSEFRLSHHIANGKNGYEENKNRIFMWKEGRVKSYRVENNGIVEEEFAYIHFQKRDMETDIKELCGCTEFYIVPNRFCLDAKINVKWIKRVSRSRLFYKKYFQLKFNSLKRRMSDGA